MKTSLLLFIAVIVVLASTELEAVPEDKIFTSSGQILPGEEWNNVYIYNDDTIVDMLGGSVAEMGAYDWGTINVTAGQVGRLDAWEFSIANVSGGEVGMLEACDSGTVKVFPDATLFRLNASGSGTAHMSGGTTEYVGAGDSGVINLYGGTITECLAAQDSSTINIYGYGFTYDPAAGSRDGGQLTGFWLDDTPFSIDLYGTGTYSHINLIPEPASLLLLALGALLSRQSLDKSGNYSIIKSI